MNQLLDSRLEALAFNYVSIGIFTIVNNLWTWLAVIMAAVSIWRIGAAGALISSSSVKTHDQKLSTSIIDRPVPEDEEKPTTISALISAPASVTETSASQRLVRDDGVTKGGKSKLTLYYEDDGGETDDEDVEMTETTEWSNSGGHCKERSCGAGEWWESWERVLSLRKGETGWHRYQDLTAINGNVVRLWDESCRRQRYSPNCALW